jgi:hypothetical protein
VALGNDENTQRELLKEGLLRAGLSVQELWVEYFGVGGTAGQFEVEAYVHGATALPALQRDLLAQVLNEKLAEGSSAFRAPYSRPLREAKPNGGPLAALVELLNGMQKAPPERIPSIAAIAGDALGVEIAVYLVDYAQNNLVGLSASGGGTVLEIDGSPPGRAFTRINMVTSSGMDRLRFWVPLLNGAERIGVLEVILGPDADLVDLHDPGLHEHCRWLAGLMAQILTSASRVGDGLHAVRDQAPASADVELIRRLLPPLSAATESFTVSGALELSAHVAGDMFDYALSETKARLAVFGSCDPSRVGALEAAVAVSAYRAARRNGHSLVDHGTVIEQTLRERLGEQATLCGVLAEVDLSTGRMDYIAADAPGPVVIRRNGGWELLQEGRRSALGLVDRAAAGQYTLLPGDWIVVFTDGASQAVSQASGDAFGVDRLIDFLQRELEDHRHPAEAVRRALRAVTAHSDDILADDATLVLACWHGPNPATPTP